MLRLTQKAREDLRLVYLEGLERFGARQADIYIDSLLDRLDLLSDFPDLAANATSSAPGCGAQRSGAMSSSTDSKAQESASCASGTA